MKVYAKLAFNCNTLPKDVEQTMLTLEGLSLYLLK